MGLSQVNLSEVARISRNFDSFTELSFVWLEKFDMSYRSNGLSN